MEPLDSRWLREHPLPVPHPDADKNSRGKVFVIGGSATVPGGALLTAEAALRAGAGKVQVATAQGIAVPLGIAMPEVAAFALEEDDQGEIAGLGDNLDTAIARSDAIVVGPAMGSARNAATIVDHLLTRPFSSQVLVLDAAALMLLARCAAALKRREPATILTPHLGEMAALLECDANEIETDREGAVRCAAERYGAIVLLKGSTSLIADPRGTLLAYAGGGVGLATAGSGDVLAGLAAGLAARGAAPLQAAAGAVWLHGEAGRRCAEQIGPLGFLARELLAQVPGLMRGI